MSTTLPSEDQPTAPDDLQDPVKTSGAALAYGSDDAPVLLQLPNLLPSSPPSPSEVTAPTDELAPVEPPAETVAEEASADSDSEAAEPPRERHQRRIERQRRKPTGPTSPSWLRNIGQYVFAVILASAIFAVFVTWKERKKDVSSTEPPSPPAVSLPDWDNNPAVVLPAVGDDDVESIWGASPATNANVVPAPATASSNSPASVATGIEHSVAPGLGVPDLRLARQPEQSEGAAAAAPIYPDTGAAPLGRDSLTTQGGASERWGDGNRSGPTRQASRPHSDQRSR